MKKNFILASLVTVLAVFSSFSALSYDGTIKFRGTIINEGCTITTKDVAVDFGKLSKNAFGGKANIVGISKDFSISLTSCDVTGALGISFDGGPDADNKNVYSSGLAGVGIQILKGSDGNNIAPGTNVPGIATIASNTATMNFRAGLISTKNNVSIGSIDKTFNFTIIYP
ncbi:MULTISPECIES: fimbrial protein [Photorhabdus]|uniref:PhfS protein n=1 Tax=Photorhabdus laumondii subsp. laumondii (strain DSM 15139 / CIP 105565 / TT01) TaxID=243265 RepID=Q7N7V4_PHOLL|nr:MULTISPECIES: fimbrial protein [Photorhabdus]AWK40918.1 fimbrial protein [Photorhabdus laumondii subsp. laumondii]AXG41727.1 type 1 fimbrial protein [Photorhabdus laumondii subsp. laumondii]AXG46256.1 type 1 fimbrial protein [Photorhabdus laumondii subsp. laumondii]KTL61192.1 fimbrial protein [Photorhabdus laumondii subsp. laumondii]MCC8386838.1 type 1 fimbrial protein [Photorhabdus laumondii]